MKASLENRPSPARRFVFTSLALIAVVVVGLSLYEFASTHWFEAVYGGARGVLKREAWLEIMDAADPWLEAWWMIPSAVAFPVLLLAVAVHGHPGAAVRDRRLWGCAGAALVSFVLAFAIGDRNGTPRGEDRWPFYPDGWEASGYVSPWWLVIPLGLVAFQFGSFARRGTLPGQFWPGVALTKVAAGGLHRQGPNWPGPFP